LAESRFDDGRWTPLTVGILAIVILFIILILTGNAVIV